MKIGKIRQIEKRGRVGLFLFIFGLFITQTSQILLNTDQMTISPFKTDKRENARSKMKRMVFNFFPAYRRTGGRVYFLSADWKEVHIQLGLNWATKNYVGSVFGGSIYGAVDPIYMVQLINILGSHYVVWDKAASIKFLKPVKGNVYARFLITDGILNEIKTKVASDNKYSIELPVNFQDDKGVIYAEITKTIYIADKAYYQATKGQR